jgi:predicted dehydrogenase
MRGALIGCGFFAQNHLHAWREMAAEGIELVAVCDTDIARARTAAQVFGIPRAYGDAAAMMKTEQLDFVDIATRMETHLELVTLAARRRTRIIVQKPLAPDGKQAKQIVELCRDADVQLAVHENFRFQGPMRKLKALVEEGSIGQVTWARIAFRTGFDVYRNQPYFHHEPRLAILDVGIHVLDLARFFLGEVERVSCETQSRNAENIGEDTATMLLRHVSGAVSVVECSYESRLDPDPFPETLISLEGEAGSIQLLPNSRAHIACGDVVEDIELASPLLPWTEKPWHIVQESVLTTQRAIIAAWRAGREAETSGRDNLKTFALVEAAYEAANSGRATAPSLY